MKKLITNIILLVFVILPTVVTAQATQVPDVEPTDVILNIDREVVQLHYESIDPKDILSQPTQLELAKIEKASLMGRTIVPLSLPEDMPLSQDYLCNEYNMYDKSPLTGFIDDWGFCTPGLVTTEVWFTKSPEYVYGTAVPYSPGMMRATATWRRMQKTAYGSEYLGGVATPSPADIGETVWLRRSGHEWEGPYLVVDCSRRADMFTHIAINQQVVEIDFDTAIRWGMAHYTEDWWVIDKWKEAPVEVHYGMEKPDENIRQYKDPLYFAEYWLENVADFQREKIELTPWIVEFGLNPVWDLRNGEGRQCFTTACSNG